MTIINFHRTANEIGAKVSYEGNEVKHWIKSFRIFFWIFAYMASWASVSGLFWS